MNKNLLISALILIMFTLILNIFWQPYIWLAPEETKKIKIDCYDEHHNRINGLVCEDIVYGLNKNEKIFWAIFGGMSPILIFLIIFLIIMRLERYYE